MQKWNPSHTTTNAKYQWIHKCNKANWRNFTNQKQQLNWRFITRFGCISNDSYRKVTIIANKFRFIFCFCLFKIRKRSVTQCIDFPEYYQLGKTETNHNLR